MIQQERTGPEWLTGGWIILRQAIPSSAIAEKKIVRMRPDQVECSPWSEPGQSGTKQFRNTTSQAWSSDPLNVELGCGYNQHPAASPMIMQSNAQLTWTPLQILLAANARLKAALCVHANDVKKMGPKKEAESKPAIR